MKIRGALKKRRMSLDKAVALGLSICMLVSSGVGYASVPPLSLPLSVTSPKENKPISIPSEFGSVEASYQGISGKTVIYIQDAHDSLEAQVNIAKIIHYLVDQYGVKTVYEEGYEGKVPTDKLFGAIKTAKVRERVAYFLMDKLRIGGAEYAHITRFNQSGRLRAEGGRQQDENVGRPSSIIHRQSSHDFQLIGADSLHLHKKNIRKYQESAKYRTETQADLQEMDAAIRKLARRYFTKDLRKWMGIKERYDRHQIDLLDYLKRALSLIESTDGEESVPQDGTREGVVIAGSIATKPSVFRNQISSLAAFVRNDMEKVKEIDAAELFRNISELEDNFAKSQLKEFRDREIFRYYKLIQLLRRLNEMEINEDEYEAVKQDLESLDTQEIARFLASQSGRSIILSKTWEAHILSAIEFYEIARARETVIETILTKAEGGGRKAKGKENAKVPRPSSTVDRPPVVLVYGGFHKNGIKRILKKQGFSYVIISPKITAISAKHQGYYKQLMRMGFDSMALPSLVTRGTTAPRLFEFSDNAKAESRLAHQIDSLIHLAELGLTNAEMDLAWTQEMSKQGLKAAAPRSEVRVQTDADFERILKAAEDKVARIKKSYLKNREENLFELRYLFREIGIAEAELIESFRTYEGPLKPALLKRRSDLLAELSKLRGGIFDAKLAMSIEYVLIMLAAAFSFGSGSVESLGTVFQSFEPLVWAVSFAGHYLVFKGIFEWFDKVWEQHRTEGDNSSRPRLRSEVRTGSPGHRSSSSVYPARSEVRTEETHDPVKLARESLIRGWIRIYPGLPEYWDFKPRRPVMIALARMKEESVPILLEEIHRSLELGLNAEELSELLESVRDFKGNDPEQHAQVKSLMASVQGGKLEAAREAVAVLTRMGPLAFEALPVLIKAADENPALRPEVSRAVDAITLDPAFRMKILGLETSDFKLVYSIDNIWPDNDDSESNTATTTTDESQKEIDIINQSAKASLDRLVPFLNGDPSRQRDKDLAWFLSWRKNLKMFDHLWLGSLPAVAAQLADLDSFFSVLTVEATFLGHYVKQLSFQMEIYCRDFGSHLGHFWYSKSAIEKTLFDVYAPLFKDLEDIRRFVTELAADIKAGRISSKQAPTKQRLAALFARRIQQMGLASKIPPEAVFKAFDEIPPQPIKVAVLDADFTLWGEAVSEVGSENVEITEAYLAIQRKILELKQQGVLLAISSRNKSEDIEAVFARRPEMLLQRSDIITLRADDRNKSEHLQEIAQELHVGLDSLVFLDDSSIERAMVRDALPEVSIPELPQAVANWPAVIDQFVTISDGVVTTESHDRTRLYQDEKERDRLRQGVKSVDEHLRALEMTVDIFEEEAGSSRIDRIVELFERTNRFNMTGRRYTRQEILDRLSGAKGNYRVFSLQLKDKVGDYGIVAAMVIDNSGTQPIIEGFCLSCRAWLGGLGIRVENLFTAYALGKLGKLVGLYVPTEKNRAVKVIYAGMGEGLSVIRHGDTEGILFDPVLAKINVPDWFLLSPEIGSVIAPVISASALSHEPPPITPGEGQKRSEVRTSDSVKRLASSVQPANSGETVRSEVRENLVAAKFRLSDYLPPDEVIDQIIIVSDNSGTLVKNRQAPIEGAMLRTVVEGLQHEGSFFVLNSGDPYDDIWNVSQAPLLQALSPEARARFSVISDGGKYAVGFDSEKRISYETKVPDWPVSERIQIARLLVNSFFKALKQKKGKLAELLKDMADTQFEAGHQETLTRLAQVEQSGEWGQLTSAVTEYQFPLLSGLMKEKLGNIFLYDVGSKVTLEMKDAPQTYSLEFVQAIEALTQKDKTPNEQFSRYVASGDMFVDVTRTTKAKAVDQLLREHVLPRLDPAKTTLVFMLGDGGNDIPTFDLKYPDYPKVLGIPIFLDHNPNYAGLLPTNTWVSEDEKLSSALKVLQFIGSLKGQTVSSTEELDLLKWQMQRSEVRTSDGIKRLASIVQPANSGETVRSEVRNALTDRLKDMADWEGAETRILYPETTPEEVSEWFGEKIGFGGVAVRNGIVWPQDFDHAEFSLSHNPWKLEYGVREAWAEVDLLATVEAIDNDQSLEQKEPALRLMVKHNLLKGPLPKTWAEMPVVPEILLPMNKAPGLPPEMGGENSSIKFNLIPDPQTGRYEPVLIKTGANLEFEAILDALFDRGGLMEFVGVVNLPGNVRGIAYRIIPAASQGFGDALILGFVMDLLAFRETPRSLNTRFGKEVPFDLANLARFAGLPMDQIIDVYNRIYEEEKAMADASDRVLEEKRSEVRTVLIERVTEENTPNPDNVLYELKGETRLPLNLILKEVAAAEGRTVSDIFFVNAAGALNKAEWARVHLAPYNRVRVQFLPNEARPFHFQEEKTFDELKKNAEQQVRAILREIPTSTNYREGNRAAQNAYDVLLQAAGQFILIGQLDEAGQKLLLAAQRLQEQFENPAYYVRKINETLDMLTKLEGLQKRIHGLKALRAAHRKVSMVGTLPEELQVQVQLAFPQAHILTSKNLTQIAPAAKVDLDMVFLDGKMGRQSVQSLLAEIDIRIPAVILGDSPQPFSTALARELREKTGRPVFTTMDALPESLAPVFAVLEGLSPKTAAVKSTRNRSEVRNSSGFAGEKEILAAKARMFLPGQTPSVQDVSLAFESLMGLIEKDYFASPNLQRVNRQIFETLHQQMRRVLEDDFKSKPLDYLVGLYRNYAELVAMTLHSQAWLSPTVVGGSGSPEAGILQSGSYSAPYEREKMAPIELEQRLASLIEPGGPKGGWLFRNLAALSHSLVLLLFQEAQAGGKVYVSENLPDSFKNQIHEMAQEGPVPFAVSRQDYREGRLLEFLSKDSPDILFLHQDDFQEIQKLILSLPTKTKKRVILFGTKPVGNRFEDIREKIRVSAESIEGSSHVEIYGIYDLDTMMGPRLALNSSEGGPVLFKGHLLPAEGSRLLSKLYQLRTIGAAVDSLSVWFDELLLSQTQSTHLFETAPSPNRKGFSEYSLDEFSAGKIQTLTEGYQRILQAMPDREAMDDPFREVGDELLRSLEERKRFLRTLSSDNWDAARAEEFRILVEEYRTLLKYSVYFAWVQTRRKSVPEEHYLAARSRIEDELSRMTQPILTRDDTKISAVSLVFSSGMGAFKALMHYLTKENPGFTQRWLMGQNTYYELERYQRALSMRLPPIEYFSERNIGEVLKQIDEGGLQAVFLDPVSNTMNVPVEIELRGLAISDTPREDLPVADLQKLFNGLLVRRYAEPFFVILDTSLFGVHFQWRDFLQGKSLPDNLHLVTVTSLQKLHEDGLDFPMGGSLTILSGRQTKQDDIQAALAMARHEVGAAPSAMDVIALEKFLRPREEIESRSRQIFSNAEKLAASVQIQLETNQLRGPEAIHPALLSHPDHAIWEKNGRLGVPFFFMRFPGDGEGGLFLKRLGDEFSERGLPLQFRDSFGFSQVSAVLLGRDQTVLRVSPGAADETVMRKIEEAFRAALWIVDLSDLSKKTYDLSGVHALVSRKEAAPFISTEISDNLIRWMVSLLNPDLMNDLHNIFFGIEPPLLQYSAREYADRVERFIQWAKSEENDPLHLMDQQERLFREFYQKLSERRKTIFADDFKRQGLVFGELKKIVVHLRSEIRTDRAIYRDKSPATVQRVLEEGQNVVARPSSSTENLALSVQRSPSIAPSAQASIIFAEGPSIGDEVYLEDWAADLVMLAKKNPKQKIVVYNSLDHETFTESRAAQLLKSFDVSNIHMVPEGFSEALKPYQFREQVNLIHYSKTEEEAVFIQATSPDWLAKKLTRFVGEPGALGHGLKYLEAMKLKEQEASQLNQSITLFAAPGIEYRRGHYVVSPSASAEMLFLQKAQFAIAFAQAA